MKETPEKNLDRHIKGLYLAVMSTLLYILILFQKTGMEVGETWVDWLFILPTLIFPLMFEIGLIKRLFFFGSTFVPLAMLGMFWTNYVDAGALIFLFYGGVVFLSIIASHFLIKDLLLTNKKLVISVLGLSLIFLVGFSLVKTNKDIVERDKNLEFVLMYENLRRCGNSFSVEEFENVCKRMEDEFGERFPNSIEDCLNNLKSKKITGYMEPSFSYDTGRCD